MEQIKLKNALNVLINSVRLAAKRGAFSLDESKIIATAVEAFTGGDEKKEEVTPSPAAKTDDAGGTSTGTANLPQPGKNKKKAAKKGNKK